MILELALEVGLHPLKTSHSHGGEFHSSCPACGGKDRFIIWPLQDKYWCRQCKKRGNCIQFCRDFLEMTYDDARVKTGNTSQYWPDYKYSYPVFRPRHVNIPSAVRELKNLLCIAMIKYRKSSEP